MIVRENYINKLRYEEARDKDEKLETKQDIHPYLELLDQAVFFDLEHYIFHKPICIGIFGAGVLEEEDFKVTQYFLENRQDLKGVVEASRAYLVHELSQGRNILVTFAGNNDLGVLRAMLKKFKVDDSFLQDFQHLDLQREMKKEFGVMFSLSKLEALVGIHRQSVEVSGSTLAKTFANIMKKPDYIKRMPKEKIQRFLSYNEADVLNLYGILKNWPAISKEKVEAQKVLDEENRQKKKALRKALREEAKVRIADKVPLD